MIRLLGAITGSALALATLLVLVGIPQFKAEPIEIDRPVVTLPLPTSPVEIPALALNKADSVPAASPAIPSMVEESAENTTVDDSEAEIAEPPAAPTEFAAEFAGESAATLDEQAAIDQVADNDAQSWYAFWSPFRSEFAASGFVDQLQRVTGLDYRVVKIKPGVYEVAFAYIDDTDINNNLSQITAATGLELPEG
ncbi:MAG: hypothetical protein OER97_09260 [Gammaproteobacteria bacterium]|nr:hypothetical protein [Gammaproteobacteria bacterium]